MRLLAAVGLWAAALVVAGPPAFGDVDVHARLDRRSLTLGETASLEVVVSGVERGAGQPEFDVPDGLEVLGSGSRRGSSSINGRTLAGIVYRYEIAPRRAGDFTLGPILVRVGGQVYRCPALSISVAAEKTRVGGAGSGPATLLVDVAPREPFVGQPVVMRVRLVQRAPLAEEPRYTPPATPGFWSEKSGEPESYYADQNQTRVLVTETRTRLYPLAAGDAEVGEAIATLVLAMPENPFDPLQWLGGHVPRREAMARSEPVRVRVRPLPQGAPSGFGGAVGGFSVTWAADRARTSQDSPITVRFEIRGAGNLPLTHAPRLELPEVETFASTVEDSMGPPGSTGPGLRRFQWTVLPRRQGRLTLEGPEFSWFDPAAAGYRRASPPAIQVDVGPPLNASDSDRASFPPVFSSHPLDPFARGCRPWAFALAGLALGTALRLGRRGARAPGEGERSAERSAWIRSLRGNGPDFWSAAERACESLEREGLRLADVRREIAAARYGGGTGKRDLARRRLIVPLAGGDRGDSGIALKRGAAAGLAVVGVAALALFSPHAGTESGVARARAADDAARAGDFDRARAGWGRLWREGARVPGLAARLAWLEGNSGEVGPAALWVLKGDHGEPRDPSLEWVIGQIRETGGLTGFAPSRLPLRPVEWALLALLLAAAGALGLGKPQWNAALVALALASSCVYPIQGWWADRSLRGVVRNPARLEGAGLELEPGQVVTLLERSRGRARVAAGTGVSGWLPADALSVEDAL